MTGAPYRESTTAPSPRTITWDTVHVTNATGLILAEQRRGWRLVAVEPAAGSPLLQRLTFEW